MKKRFTAVIVQETPNEKYPNAARRFSHLYVIATSEEEARRLVEQHLFERKPLGFTEREIRKVNPKRTPWIPGLKVFYFMPGNRVSDREKIGVVTGDDEGDPEIPF